MPHSKRQTPAAKEAPPSLPTTKPDRSVTIHPRVSVEEDQVVKSMAAQLRMAEMALWGESASDGLIITLIKHGPDEQGLYGGRWTPKELAQIARRRSLLNTLIDFQLEHDELPALLKDYIETLKALAEKSQGIMVAGNKPLSQQDIEEPVTEEDVLVFSQAATPTDVNESLGGMGFGRLGLKAEHSS